MPEPIVDLTHARPTPTKGSLLAVPIPPEGSPLEAIARVEQRLGVTLRDRLEPAEVRRDEGALTLVPARPRIALVGLGSEVDDDAVRNAAAAAAHAAREGGETLVWAFDRELLLPEPQLRAVVEGVLIGGHDPARWKTTPTRPGIARLSIAGAPADLAPALARAASVARWTNRARELVDAPPNEMTPEGLARATTALFEGLPIDVEVLDLAAIEREGMRALAAVGRGSANEPRLIVLRYRPGTAPVASLGLIGKGVTFDSGGLFLKQQSDIVRQKADMGGAAAVIAAVGALAELQVGVGILAVIPAAENMLDGAAFRPGDILTTAAGLTVEVTNPDAEGRLLLAEGIWYAKREGADRLVDIATLTGAMRGGMGDMFSGVFANEIEWRSRIVQAGRASGDHAWPWPMHRRYDRPLESQLADLRSTAGRSFGYPIFAAAFLARFAGTTPWAHVDIHSTALLDEARGYLGAGATGAGVRLLVELAAGLSSPT